MTTDYDSVDYFTDPSLVPDPHPYFDYLRAKNPVSCPINNGVLAVTGWEAANAVYKDTENYSSCVAVAGPFTPMPFVPEGDDICAQLEEHRTEIPMYEHMVTMDPPNHTDARSLLSRLLTPKRLKENEDFMWRLADRHIDEFINDGQCEFLAAYARPFSLLVVADLLGVPEEDHEEFREAFGAQRPGTNIGGLDHEPIAANPLEWADEKFSHYIEDRRSNPRDDVLTGWPRRCTRTVRPPRWSTWSAPPRSSSAPDRKPPPSCSVRRCGCSATGPTSSSSCATTAASSRSSSRNACAWTAR